MRSETDRKVGSHLQRAIMAPENAPWWVTDPEKFWKRVGSAERRCDALEAWIFDVQWPRELPPHLFHEVAEGIYGYFRDRGLVVQVDFETAPAADGGENPHLHALISTRPINVKGFSEKKDRRINSFFRLAGGFGPRFHVARVLTDVAARNEIPVRFDGHSNNWRNLPPGEDRLPAHVKRDPSTQLAKSHLARRAAQRGARRKFEAVVEQIDLVDAAETTLTVQLAREKDAQIAFQKRSAPSDRSVWNFLSSLGPSANSPSGGSGYAYAIDPDRYVWDDEDAIRVDGEITYDSLLVVSRVASANGLNGLREAANLQGCYNMPRTLEPAWFQPGAFHRVASVIGDILEEPMWKDKLLSWRNALVKDGSPGLASIADDLGGLRSLGAPVPQPSDIAAIVGDHPRSGLWARYRLSLEADLSDVPFTEAGRVLAGYNRRPKPGKNSPKQPLELSAAHSTLPSDTPQEVKIDVDPYETGEGP